MRILLALLLAGCAHTITAYPEQPKQTHAVDQVEIVTLRLKWLPSVDAIQERCNPVARRIVYACAEVVKTTEGTLCWIYAMPPKDFNDLPLLALLGHEVMHCYMARHE